MNGQTAKLIRKVASKRNMKSPKYVRSLKRDYYKLTEEEKELKKIEWRMEIEDFISEIEREFSKEVKTVQEKLSGVESKATRHKSKAESARSKYNNLYNSVDTAPFVDRVKYAFRGDVKILTQKED